MQSTEPRSLIYYSLVILGKFVYQPVLKNSNSDGMIASRHMMLKSEELLMDIKQTRLEMISDEDHSWIGLAAKR